jgi:hypothetical protein
MTRSALRLAGLLSIVLLSCAEGFGSGDNLALGLVNNAGVSGGGSGGRGGQSMSGGTGGAAGGAYTGMPCTQGDAPDCDCPTGGMGTRICRYDAMSPTMGTFAECTGCVASGGAGGNSGDAASGSGGGGSGGRSGSGGSGSGGSGSGGSGGSGSGGSSGAGGSSGTGSSSSGCPASGCTNSCFPAGAFSCCTAFDSCGCTWAPGAYCL